MTTKVIHIDDAKSEEKPDSYQIEWCDSKGAVEVIEFDLDNEIDFIKIENSVGTGTCIFKDDIPKLIKALNIAQEIINANK